MDEYSKISRFDFLDLETSWFRISTLTQDRRSLHGWTRKVK